MPESDALHARVRAFVRAAMEGDRAEPFDALALDIARFQAAFTPPIRRLVAAGGVDLATATSAGEIPAVPCDVFRLARVAAHAPALDTRVFRTSGTTQDARGEHAFRTTGTYELVALEWARRLLFADLGPRPSVLVLAPPVDEAPDSSLGFMIDLFARAIGGAASWHLRGGRIDLEGLEIAAAAACERGVPVLLMGTSFAFVHVSDALGNRSLALPPNSLAMQTGGFKGRSRVVAPAEMRALIERTFGVEARRIVGEYGMTELSSQLYEGHVAGACDAGMYLSPPWMRVTAVDPATLLPVGDGEAGVARFVDLANVDSAVAVQTADRVRVVGGDRVELLGRAEGATPRGCSLAVDAMLSGIGSF